MRAFLARQGNLRVTFHDGNHIAADSFCHLYEHESDRSTANNGNGVANFDSSFVESAQHACKRFSHGGVLKTDARRHDEHVGLYDAARNSDVLGISAVIEQKIFAKIELMFRTIKTRAARSGVESNHAHAFFEAAHTLANFFDSSRELVPEQSRGHNHAGVIAALVHLQISAACKRDVNFD